MFHGFLDCDALVGVEGQQSIEQIVKHIVVALSRIVKELHASNVFELKLLDIFGEFEFIT